MLAELTKNPPMAKRPGRPKTNPEMTGIRIDKEANDLAREAGAIFGESIVTYVSRIVREKAKADIIENARRRVREADLANQPPKPKDG